jgi:hypothetical protein
MEEVEFHLPKPAGPHNIGTTELYLVDHERADPWVDEKNRELMVSIWYPAKKGYEGKRAPYMQSKTAQHIDQHVSPFLGLQPGQVDWERIEIHAWIDAPVEYDQDGYPIVLFSPGFGNSRTTSTYMVEELVSHGYVVVTIDHTYETDGVEFPDGRIVGQEIPTSLDAADVIKKALEIRTRDVQFVLDQLSDLKANRNPDAENKELPAGFSDTLDLSRIGMFGHSAGGDTTAGIMDIDDRIDAGIDMDGWLAYDFDGELLSPVAESGLERPILLMGSGEAFDSPPRTHLTNPAWKSFWDHSTGWKLDLNIPEGKHYTFTDHQVILPQIADQFELPDEVLDSYFNDLIGTVDSRRITESLRAYVIAFFDQHLKGQPQQLLDGPSTNHPDIHFIKEAESMAISEWIENKYTANGVECCKDVPSKGKLME